MLGERYEGVDEATARKLFAKHGLYWDTVTCEELPSRIGDQDEQLVPAVASTFFVFCDLRFDSAPNRPGARRQGRLRTLGEEND